MYGAKELSESFDTVRRNTIQIAEDIPADKYDFRAAPLVKSVGEMLAHVAVSPRWQIEVHSQRIPQIDFAFFGQRLARSAAEEEALRTKEQILAALDDGGKQFAAFIAGLSPDVLSETVSFPPPVQPARKSRFEMIANVKEHEMHHRGQLMLIERMLGIVPHLTRKREAMRAART
jgi:uncharacterized damage-inducible protein DinB